MSKKVVINALSVRNDNMYSVLKIDNQRSIELLHSLLLTGESADFIIYEGTKSVLRLNNYYVGYMHLDGSHVVIRFAGY